MTGVHNTDDWKLKVWAIVKLKKECDGLVFSLNFVLLITFMTTLLQAASTEFTLSECSGSAYE